MVKKRKKRYLIVEPNIDIQPEILKDTVEKTYMKLFGEFGYIEAGIRIVKKLDRRYILECFYKDVPKLVFALSSICQIEGVDTHLRILGVSGTIKALLRKINKMRLPEIIEPKPENSDLEKNNIGL